MIDETIMMRIIGSTFANFLENQVPPTQDELRAKRALFTVEFLSTFMALVETVNMAEARHICTHFPSTSMPFEIHVDDAGNISVSDGVPVDSAMPFEVHVDDAGNISVSDADDVSHNAMPFEVHIDDAGNISVSDAVPVESAA